MLTGLFIAALFMFIFVGPFCQPGASLVAQLAKNPLVMQETWVRSLGWEDSLEKGTATHSSVLAWRMPWTAQSMHGVAKSDTTE